MSSMSDEIFDIGKKLKDLRTEKGLTQEELAKLLSINSVTYLHYEKNQRRPSYELLIKIADFYGVTLDYLFDRKEY